MEQIQGFIEAVEEKEWQAQQAVSSGSPEQTKECLSWYVQNTKTGTQELLYKKIDQLIQKFDEQGEEIDHLKSKGELEEEVNEQQKRELKGKL